MRRFEYRITTHESEAFKMLVYFCSEDGRCNVDQVPADQTKKLGDLLNDHGGQGWELIQLAFGKDGAMAFWKREII